VDAINVVGDKLGCYGSDDAVLTNRFHKPTKSLSHGSVVLDGPTDLEFFVKEVGDQFRKLGVLRDRMLMLEKKRHHVRQLNPTSSDSVKVVEQLRFPFPQFIHGERFQSFGINMTFRVLSFREELSDSFPVLIQTEVGGISVNFSVPMND
jgi:hypothetical protein